MANFNWQDPSTVLLQHVRRSRLLRKDMLSQLGMCDGTGRPYYGKNYRVLDSPWLDDDNDCDPHVARAIFHKHTRNC